MCFTKRGLGTFVTEESTVVTAMREAMAKELLDGFVREMKDLGFTKDELLKVISEQFGKTWKASINNDKHK